MSERMKAFAILISRNFVEFISIWSVEQWISSLTTLTILYWGIMGSIFNKICQKYTGRIWLTKKGRCGVIGIDLSANLFIGMYYMNYRDTAMGQFMLMCPLALSPFIFLIELTLLFVYCYYYRSK